MEASDEPLYSEDIQACREDARAALVAAAPHMAAQVLREAVEAFPLETITAPDNAVVWLRRRAEQLDP